MDSTNTLPTEIDNEALIENRFEQNLVKKPRIIKLLGVSERTVDNYLADGLPHIKPSARMVLFDEGDVMKWFKNKYGQQRRRPSCSQSN